MTINLLIADDHELVRRGLHSMLVGSDTKIVAETTDGLEAIQLAARHQRDVVLLDMRVSYAPVSRTASSAENEKSRLQNRGVASGGLLS